MSNCSRGPLSGVVSAINALPRVLPSVFTVFDNNTSSSNGSINQTTLFLSSATNLSVSPLEYSVIALVYIYIIACIVAAAKCVD